MKKKINTLNIDTSIPYIIPMVPDQLGRYIKNAIPTEVNITVDNGNVFIIKPGYHSLFFYDFYFEYLVNTGYIKPLKLHSC